MPRQHRPAGHGPAIGSPLMQGGGSRKHKPKDYLTTAGIVAAGMAGSVWAHTNGQGVRLPAVLGSLSILVATVYWHRRDRARRVLLGALPVAVIFGMSLAQWAPSKSTAAQVTTTASAAHATVSAGTAAKGWDVLAWLADKAGEVAAGLVKP